MSRRSFSLALDVFLVFLGALLGIATNYATNTASDVPYAFRLLQHWSLPLVGICLALLLAGRAWLYWAERTPSAKHVWTSARPPFPGLEAFTELDAGVFYGRDPESDQLLDRLQPTLPGQAHRFVSVIGPSGAGKSSLVHAGLLPRLAQRRNRWLVVPTMVPENRPIENLSRSLAAVLPDVAVDRLTAELAADPVALARCTDRLRTAHNHRSASVLIVVDQAEELLTLTGEQEGRTFLELLRSALLKDSRLWVVAVLRSEFLTSFLQAGFADLFFNPVTIGMLDRSSLLEVIQEPAAKAALTLGPGLVSRLVDDAGSGDALPLLAYTLQALYLKVGSGGTVTLDDYHQLGGVAGTLAKQADKVTAELQASETSAPVITTLLKFVSLDEAEPTRRRVQRSSLKAGECTVVDAFIEARLLTSDTTDDDATIQVAHEALFRQWAPLQQAIEARADDLRQRTQLERWAEDWLQSGRRHSYLLRDERLAIAQQWAARQGELAVELPLVHEFLEFSARSDNAALERLSEAIARRALASVEHDPEQSILLALAAIEECAPTPLAQRALLTALASSRVRALLRGHTDVVRKVGWSPDGGRLVSGSHDGTARIWDAEASTELAVLRGHTEPIRSVAWSPDGRRIATASNDRTARIWDAEAGTVLAVLRGHDGVLHDAAWSPDSKRLATGSHDGTARTWDAEAGTELAVLRGHADWVDSVAWSPDGRRVATASSDGTARIWDAEASTELAVLRGHTEWVQGVDWSPDGDRIATASRDRTARIWDARAGTEAAVLRGHDNWVHDVAWSPDGRRLATASRDRTARVWSAERGTELAVLRAHENWIEHLAWSPDGRRIATGSNDHTARLWDAEAGLELAELRGHKDWVRGVAWSPDGRRVATASRDSTIRIWDAEAGTEVAVLRGHGDWVEDVAWSPDGRRIATGSNDHTARVWDAEASTELVVLRGHDDWVGAVAWSPDGRRIATASVDRTARTWDAERGSELAVLCVHDSSVEDVAWSPDGRRIVTASRDRTVQVLDAMTDLEALAVTARRRVFRELTDDERRSAMLPVDRMRPERSDNAPVASPSG